MLRAFEIVLTCLALLIFSPLILLITVLIVVDSGTPIFFLSPRIGKHGRDFRLFYFRTMRPGAAPSGQRLTRVGRFLRGYSFDHLPQLFNLLRGDMQLIGPRPMGPDEVDMRNENYQQVIKVKPGMISPAILQLGNQYNAADFATRAKLERTYLDGRSVGRDIWLVGHFIFATVKSRGNVKQRGERRIQSDSKD